MKKRTLFVKLCGKFTIKRFLDLGISPAQLPLNKRPFVLLLLKAKWIWTIISILFPV
ncbi:hypothetical protein BACDOR_01579 [Phocaeicola dorei DSM 17855]|uniref:Uncharacterized protein n=1 Tax=Phocaeicola dorei DSM 17855 TaxID=483217 RepID=B6VW86_9BACT|nr:hypothetical protein BACDOR_01579 [Phocaeicola dorei DSM 17855]